MSLSLWRQNTAVVCVLLVMAGLVTVPACDTAPMGGEVGAGGVTLSSTELSPGQFLTVRHSSITADVRPTIRIQSPDGLVMDIEAATFDDGMATVAVPPLVDPATGEFISATVQVSLPNVSGSTASLDVLPMVDVAGGSPGALLVEVLTLSVELADAAEARAAATAGVLGATTTPADLEFFAAQRAAVGSMLTELATTGELTVETQGGNVIRLTADGLARTDRVLASFMKGIIEESGGSSAALLKRTSFQAAPGAPVIIDFDALGPEFRRVASNIVNGGGAFLGSLTLIVAGAALALSGVGEVAVVGGLILTVGGAVWAVGSTGILNGIGQFFDDKLGDLFNEANVAMEQAVSVGVTALGTLRGQLGQLFSSASTLLTGVTTYESFTKLECQTEPAPNPKRIRATAQTVTFCTLVLPPPDNAPTPSPPPAPPPTEDCPLDGFCSLICLQGTDPDCDLCGANGICIQRCGPLFGVDPDCP